MTRESLAVQVRTEPRRQLLEWEHSTDAYVCMANVTMSVRGAVFSAWFWKLQVPRTSSAAYGCRRIASNSDQGVGLSRTCHLVFPYAGSRKRERQPLTCSFEVDDTGRNSAGIVDTGCSE